MSIIFSTWCTELIWNITVIDLPISLTYCCYTTLGNKGKCTIITYSPINQSYTHYSWTHTTQLGPVHTSNIVEATFDFVATNGNNVERFYCENFVLSTKSKQIEHVQFVSTSSKGRNFVQRCCRKRQQCRSNIRHCGKNRSTCSVRQCCFDIVATMDGASMILAVAVPLRSL